MQDTYTYIARDQHQSDRVITLTLHEDKLSVGLGPALEHIQRMVGDARQEERSMSLSPWLIKPTAVWLFQQGGQAFHIRDVSVFQERDASLGLRLWVHLGGLKVFPISFAFDEIDNPQAAQAFVEEIEKRQQAAEHPGKLHGLLDYWLSWAAFGVVISLLLAKKWRSNDE